MPDNTPQPREEQALSDWLKQLRETAKLSQRQAAETIGVSTREIRRWETANAPGGVNLIRLLSAYGVRFDQAPPAEIPGAVNAELRELRDLLTPLAGLAGDEGEVAVQGKSMTTALRGLKTQIRALTRAQSPEQADTAQRASRGSAR